MITICFTYFRSLTLANLAAALHSVRRQDLTRVKEVIIFDNDSDDDPTRINDIIDEAEFPNVVTVKSHSVKHGDFHLTHAWSTNKVVNLVTAPWIFFTRADYLLDFNIVERFIAIVDAKGKDWNGFITSNGSHLAVGIDECEKKAWRQAGPQFRGMPFDYTSIDSGVWMARKDAFDRINGLDERLTAWGHAQTEFQHRMFKAGVEFVRIPEVLFWHPHHGGSKSIDVAHRQLAEVGVDLKECWARYHGESPYA